MKILFTLALLCAPASFAQGLSVDLLKTGHAIKALHGHVTSAVAWRRATGLMLASADIIDWRTTYIGVVNGPNCEENPVFQNAGGCKINKPRFNVVKGAILGVVLAEELTPKLPHQDFWNRTFIIGNVAGSIALGIVDGSNIHVLVTQK
jgi:hypothetical protein